MGIQQSNQPVGSGITATFFVKKLHAIKLLFIPLLNNTHSKYFILTSLLLLLPFALVLGAVLNNEKHHWNTLVEDYGTNIAEISSNQLTISLSKNNQIGLQSLLNDLTDQGNIVNAVVYDVDNNIIVQAGEINTTRAAEGEKTITTPITLDNSVLGSLTITLSTSSLNNTTNAIILSLIFILLIAAALFFLFQNITQKVKESNSHIGPLPATTAEVSTDKTPTEESSALLILHIHTIEKLYRQLNAEARQKQFNQLQSLIKKVLTLYSGNQIAATSETILIKFNDYDQSTCFFNALCSAYLLNKANQKQQSLLHFSSILYDTNTNIDACETLFDIKQQLNDRENQILVQRKIIENTNIEERVIFDNNTEESKGSFIKIIDLSESYCQLLKNQLAHLSS
ncbi:MAG: hypothetical protein ACRBCI_05935 [Cellvibrionaceae bacterium]